MSSIDPNDPNALLQAGIEAQQRGEHRTAALHLRQCTRIAPQSHEAFHGLGAALRAMGQLDAAVASFKQALTLIPQSANTHTCLGNALRERGNFSEAVAEHQKALELEPDSPEILSNLGLAFRDWGRFNEALDCFSRAVALNPQVAALHHNFGNTALKGVRLEQAEASLRRALEIDPKYARARVDLATVLKAQGRVDEAERELRLVIDTDATSADAHWNLALTLLLAGNYAQGWSEYEWRREIQRVPMRRTTTPVWKGESLAGRTLLVHAEQGLGDTIQFARYLPLIRERVERDGGQALFEVRPHLMRVLQSLWPRDELVIPSSHPPEHDMQLPLLSAPLAFNNDHPSKIPGPPAYLVAEQELIDHWKKRLASYDGIRVGICWQGNPNYVGDAQRSIPLYHFLGLTEIPGVQLFSLQKVFGQDQLAGVPSDIPLENLAPELDPGDDPFVDTAAVISLLDLVITCDTAIAHLAGALGANVWVPLAHVPDWRWGLIGDSTPWYPTMRLFRQRHRGDWNRVFADMADELRLWSQ